MHHDNDNHPETYSDKIKKATGEIIENCYQCGKCTAGCPLASDMEYPPSLMMRMLQTGDESDREALLRSLMIWYCVSCETCATRCPQEVSVANIADFLRQESYRKKMVHKGARNIVAFHKTFLDSIKYTGRLYEVGLIAGYKMRSGKLLQDLLAAPGLFLRGKLSLFPHPVKNRKALRRIFKKTEIQSPEEI